MPDHKYIKRERINGKYRYWYEEPGASGKLPKKEPVKPAEPVLSTKKLDTKNPVRAYKTEDGRTVYAPAKNTKSIANKTISEVKKELESTKSEPYVSDEYKQELEYNSKKNSFTNDKTEEKKTVEPAVPELSDEKAQRAKSRANYHLTRLALEDKPDMHPKDVFKSYEYDLHDKHIEEGQLVDRVKDTIENMRKELINVLEPEQAKRLKELADKAEETAAEYDDCIKKGYNSLARAVFDEAKSDYDKYWDVYNGFKEDYKVQLWVDSVFNKGESKSDAYQSSKTSFFEDYRKEPLGPEASLFERIMNESRAKMDELYDVLTDSEKSKLEKTMKKALDSAWNYTLEEKDYGTDKYNDTVAEAHLDRSEEMYEDFVDQCEHLKDKYKAKIWLKSLFN